jgi:hypothetical protein
MSGQAGGSGSNKERGLFGGDYIRDQYPDTYDEYLAKKAGQDAQPKRFVTYDNELGEVTLRLPTEYQKWQSELIEAVTDEYYGAPAGDRKVLDEMNSFVGEWLKKKQSEEAQSL